MNFKCKTYRTILFGLIAIMMFTFSSCKDDKAQVAQETTEKENISDEEVTSSDDELEQPQNYADKIVIATPEDVNTAMQYDAIRYLKIDSANISDFSFMSGIKIDLLQILYNDHPVDLSYLNKDIDKLYFHNVEIKDTSVISEFSDLTYFAMKNDSNVPYPDEFDFLSPCTKIEELEIENYGITNLDFAKNMKQLKKISVINSSIDDICGIKDCTSLTTITINRAMLEDIPSLAATEVYTLSLRDNYISDISPLKNMDKHLLSFLDLGDNFISEIDDGIFDDAKHLWTVNFDRNYLTELPPFSFRYESVIDLSYNNISSVSEEKIKEIVDDKVQINLYDNLLDEETVRKLDNLTYYNEHLEEDVKCICYTTGSENELDIEQVIAYTNKKFDALEKCNKGNDKEKLFRVSDYVCSVMKLDYSYSSMYMSDSYGALCDKAVCGGTTELTSTLLRHMGIRSKDYNGDYEDPYDDSRHVWNVVNIDGKYYHCDAMQGIARKAEDGYIRILMVDDEQMKGFGHILDALNRYPCSAISEEERMKIVEGIS